MSKFTKRQRNELKSLVANAMIRRLDIHETQKHIADSMHVTISADYGHHVKMQLKIFREYTRPQIVQPMFFKRKTQI